MVANTSASCSEPATASGASAPLSSRLRGLTPPARLLTLLPVPLDKRGIDLSGNERRVIEDLTVQRNRRVYALDAELAQRPAHGGDGLGARRLVYQQLRHE